MKNVNEILFRCSSLGHLMAEPKSKKIYLFSNTEITAQKYNKILDKAISELDYKTLNELKTKSIEVSNDELSEGAKTHCVDVFASWYYSRREDAYSKYMEKGTAVEEDAITLLSLETKNLYFKNEDNLKNDYISGTPDLFVKKDGVIEVVEDIKSSWDIFTFLRTKNKDLNTNYYWQLMGYLWLTGATKANIRYCLVNSTADLIDAEKRKTAWQMNLIDADANPEYVERCKQIERNMIYDIKLFQNHYPYFNFHSDLNEWVYDIPQSERLFTFSIERSEEDISLIISKVIKARMFIQTLLPNEQKTLL